MGEVIELKEPFSYMFVGAKIVGVKWGKRGSSVRFWGDGEVSVNGFGEPEPHELKTLMIMWLSLEYPEVINFDVK